MATLGQFWLRQSDVAPVALFRILFGLQLFNWFWQLFPNLTAFFTDAGILPRRELALSYPDRFSLLNAAGDWWPVALLWALSCLVAAALTLGWHTRVMCLLAFVLVSSFSWRDPLILDGSDLVFRLVPLWLAFTAAGERWSLDARRSTTAPPASAWSFPIRVLELQIAWIYLTSGLEKVWGIDWIEGTAAYYALQLEHTFARPWANAFAVDPAISHLITWYTLAVELAFLPLALVPFRLTRTIAALAAAAMHLGILLLMNVGNFPLVMLATCVLFLPPEWLRSLPSGASDGGTAPRPSRERRAAGALLAVTAVAALATAVPSQLEPLRPAGNFASVLRYLSLDQRWDMFSPNSAKSDWWLFAPAVLANGERLDLLSDRDPDDRSERYSDPLYSRWTKVHERIASPFYAGYRSEYARHYCRTRTRLGAGRSPLVSFELLYVERTIQPPEKGPPLISESRVWSQQC